MKIKMTAMPNRPLWLLVSALVASALAPPLASANDRPFQVARTAVLEDD